MSDWQDEWEVVALGDVAEIINGRAYKLSEWETSGTPVIRLQNLTQRGGDFYFSNLALPEKQYCTKGDLLYMWSATFGPHIWWGEKAIFHYHIWKIEPNERIDKKFLFYLLDAKTQEWKTAGSGMAMIHLTKAGIEKELLCVPPLPEQKKIAEILSGIDNLIASAKRQEAKNKNLALGVAECILTSNCERRRLGDATTLITKGTTPTSLGMSFSEQGINFIKVESITSDGAIDPSKFSFIETDVHDALQRSQIKSKDILFTIAGATVGKLALAEERHLPANTNQALAIIRVKNEMLRPRFAYHWLKSGTIKTIVDQLQTVGAQPNVSLSQISDFPVPIIPLDSQDYICDKLDSIDRVTGSIREKIFTMQRLRQSLSADLLSGRKRVSV